MRRHNSRSRREGHSDNVMSVLKLNAGELELF